MIKEAANTTPSSHSYQGGMETLAQIIGSEGLAMCAAWVSIFPSDAFGSTMNRSAFSARSRVGIVGRGGWGPKRVSIPASNRLLTSLGSLINVSAIGVGPRLFQTSFSWFRSRGASLQVHLMAGRRRNAGLVS